MWETGLRTCNSGGGDATVLDSNFREQRKDPQLLSHRRTDGKFRPVAVV